MDTSLVLDVAHQPAPKAGADEGGLDVCPARTYAILLNRLLGGTELRAGGWDDDHPGWQRRSDARSSGWNQPPRPSTANDWSTGWRGERQTGWTAQNWSEGARRAFGAGWSGERPAASPLKQ